MTPTQLAAALIFAVNGQNFGNTPDKMQNGQPVAAFPSIDIAVIAFPENGQPVGANVMFSRDYKGGLVAQIAPSFGEVRNLRYLADQIDSHGKSVAWLPGADWDGMRWETLFGEGQNRFVAPYPASLIKLMVLVGVAREADAGRSAWDVQWSYAGKTRYVHEWAEDMIVLSSNEATSAMVALLHSTGAIVRDATGERGNMVNDVFARYGLKTLRLSNTKADGGWTNPAGAGVGHLQMTAWDSARLLWLLDAGAPAAPWLVQAQPPIVTSASRDRMRAMLEGQALHEVLSSTLLAGVPGWQVGIPAKLPDKWIKADGSAELDGEKYPADVRISNGLAQVRFAHKTGTTENFLADVGIVTGIAPNRRHYVISLITNLGTRYAPDDLTATTWRVPALGAAIDSYLAEQLEPKK